MSTTISTTDATTTTTGSPLTATVPAILQSAAAVDDDISNNIDVNLNLGQPAIASPSPPPSVAEVSPSEELPEVTPEPTTTEDPSVSATTVTPSSVTTSETATNTDTTTTATTTTSTTPSGTSRDVEDGKHYVNRKCFGLPPCREYAPTLEELQEHSFPDYVRKVVLEGARVKFEDEVKGFHNGEEEEDNDEPSSSSAASLPPQGNMRSKGNNKASSKSNTNNNNSRNNNNNNNGSKKSSRAPQRRLYAEGMAKVTLPKGFWKEEGISQDRTGRGPAWQKGTPLGDMMIVNPIKQCVRGIGGVYEYTLLDQPSISVHEYREQADAYYEQQLYGKRIVSPPKQSKSSSSSGSSGKAKPKKQSSSSPGGSNNKNDRKRKATTSSDDASSSRAKRLQHRNEIRKAEEQQRKEAASKEDGKEEGKAQEEKQQQQQQQQQQPSKEEDTSNSEDSSKDKDNNSSSHKNNSNEKVAYRGPPTDALPEGRTWPEGWVKVSKERTNLDSQGNVRVDHSWISPCKKTFRSLRAAQAFLLDNNNNKDKNGNNKKESERKPPTIEELERKFWKRLGPTMPPATYGADMEGSLFGEDPANGWNLGRLDSFLHLLGPNLPGVTSPYLYFGMWGSVFAVHTEDMNLLSINYLHAGAPKIWYAIAPGPDAKRLETLAEHYFSHAHRDCKQFLRHKRCLLSPMILKKAGIKFTMQIQYPGDAMITMPGGYHFGFNSGFNVAEATNFGVPEWIPFGHEAKICMCRPDSVRIDMIRLERLLCRYMKENKRKTSRRRKSYRDWGILHAKAHMKPPPDSESDSESEDEDSGDGNNNSSNNLTGPPKASKKPKMKDFWVEVMAPVPSSQRADYGRRVSTGSQPKTVTPKKRSRSKGKQDQQPLQEREVWHLAKPMTRKGLVLNAKVLVMIPGASTMCEPDSSDSSDDDNLSDQEEDEQCFAGTITEFTEEHCRVHFDRLPRDDDVWMHIESHKLFLDGGRWDELQEDKQALPPRHYWQELDSKRRCV